MDLTMNDLLTCEELFQLTGTRRVSAQKRVLNRAGIAYIEQVGGSIATTWHYVHRAPYAPSIVAEDDGFHLDALK